jgi:tRNA (guanine37-N1)-methyltransferase
MPARFDVLTLFPAAFTGPLDVSMIQRARDAGRIEVHTHDIRDYATDRHRTVDDYPFGGGQGMVLRVDVLDAALQDVQAKAEAPGLVVYLTPQGEKLDDRLVREFATHERLILVCGRYEGVDERFVQHRVDRQVSIGDFVLTGGELPAMVLIDAVARHVTGVLGDEASPEEESFADGLLEHPQYTRPAEYEGWKVPDVLLGGEHAAVERWRRDQRVERTRMRRPDLLPPLEDANQQADDGLVKIGVDGVRVRSFEYPGDVPHVLALWRSAGHELHLGPSDEPAELAKKLQRDPGLFLVAVARGDIIGAVVGAWDGREGHAYQLAVAESWRMKGVGRGLMLVLESRLRTLGCSRISVMVNPGAASAAHFYEGEGWTRRDGAVFIRDLLQR